MKVIICLVLLATIAHSATAATDPCAHLESATLDRLLPELAPWSLQGGGAGRCAFLSRSDQPMGRVTLMLEPQRTAAAAIERVLSLRTATEASYRVERIAALGPEGFSYEPREPSEGAQPSIWWVGHRDRLVARGTLSLPPHRPLSDRQAIFEFLRGSLALDPAALEAQLACPWFDSTSLSRLLGDEITAQALGSASCLATTRPYGPALIATVIDPHNTVALPSSSSCRWRPLPELGATARVGSDCEGRPHAVLDLPLGDQLVRYNLDWPDGVDAATVTKLIDHARAVHHSALDTSPSP